MTPNYEHFEQVVKQLHEIWLNDTSEDMDVIMPLMDKIILDAKIKFSGDDPDTFYTAINTALADDYKWFYNTCYDCLDFGQEREQDDEDPHEDDSEWREWREYFEERNN